MKICGIDPRKLPPVDFLVLPRAGGELVIKARGVSDMDEFDKICPEPIATSVLMANGESVPETDSKDYLSQKITRAKKRYDYLVIKSLAPSDIEWDNVRENDSNSWVNWRSDLTDNGFTSFECNLIFDLVLSVNSLDDAKLEKARKVFLLGHPQEAAT